MFLRHFISILILVSSLLNAQENAPKIEKEYESLEVLAKSLFYIESLYVDEDKVKREDLVQKSLKGIMASLDPHSIYFPKDAFKQFTVDTKGKFGGVGVIVSHERGKVVVVSAIEDTPAYKAGVLTGDEIVAIDGRKISDLGAIDPLALMRGDIGSILKLEVKRKGLKKNIEFRLRRELIKVKSVKDYKLSDNISLLRISSFQEDTFSQLNNFMSSQNDLGGLIIDLRGNPGGLLDKAVETVDLFIESGIIISTAGRDASKVEREYAKKRGTIADLPIVLMIDAGSASAAEVVAGALQDYKRALIIGQKSFGKGSVQTLINLPDGSGIKLTVAKYYTPLNRSIHGLGIEPDLAIRLNQDSSVKNDSQKMTLEIQKLLGLNSSINTQSWPENYRSDSQIIASTLLLNEWLKNHKKGQNAVVPKSLLAIKSRLANNKY